MSQGESSNSPQGGNNVDQGSVNIRQMFDCHRFETNLDVFFACLYFPIGICLFIIRLFIFIQVLLISILLPNDSYARSVIFRSIFFALGIIVQEEDFNLKNCKAQLVVSNRVSDFDPLVVNLIYPCASHSIIAFPWYITWLFGISKETFAQHQNDLSTVIRESSVPVLCFPEASQTNGKVGLFKFESWPFSSDLTSHLVFIKSQNPLFNVSTSPLGASWHSNLFWLLFFPVTIFNIRYLASLEKAENETVDEYTKRVQLKMASCTSLVASNFDNSDKKEMMKRIQDEHRRKNIQSPRVSAAPSVEVMARKVKEVLPQVPLAIIKNDIVITKNIDDTIERILNGNVPYTPETTPSSDNSKASSSSGATGGSLSSLDVSGKMFCGSSFGKTADERTKSFQERKEHLYRVARMRYIQKHKLVNK